MEPAFGVLGAQKQQLVQSLSRTPCDSSLFVKEISKPLFDILLVKKKVMPSAQYEESLKKLSKLLADQEFCECLKSKLLLCLPEDQRNVPDVPVKRLVWRIVSKLLFKMHELIFRTMKKNHRTALEKFVMSESDRDAFKKQVEKILRTVYRFGIDKKNSVWALRCQCLRDRFVDAPRKVTSEQFLNQMSWRENSISLNTSCLTIFMGVERIIQDLLDSSSPCTSDVVFISLSNPENLFLLSEMRLLSQGIMSEEVAIMFLQELVKSLTAVSGRTEARRSLEKHSQKQKTSTVSLRTNLKRDPKKRAPLPPTEAPHPPSSKSKPSTSKKRRSPPPTLPPTPSKLARVSKPRTSNKQGSTTPAPGKLAGAPSKPSTSSTQSTRGTKSRTHQPSEEDSLANPKFRQKPSSAQSASTPKTQNVSSANQSRTRATSQEDSPAVPTRSSTRVRRQRRQE